MADVTLLQTVPGVGLITATALVALVTDIRRFPSGRHFASFLGLTPKGRLERVAPTARGHQQARGHLFTHADHTRCSIGAVAREDGHRPDVATALGGAE